MNFIFIFFIVVIASCSSKSSHEDKVNSADLPTKSDTSYVWTKLLDSADWKKSYNFEMFSIQDTLWVFHFDGNWFSTDGINWTKSQLPNSITNLAFLDYVQFKDAIYGLGNFEGNIEKHTFKNEIYKTTDLQEWTTIANAKGSNLPNRFFYHPFVYAEKIWIIGGEDKNMQYSDIWNSTNAIEWKLQKDNLLFSMRSNNQVVFLNGKLFLLGNDVWSSTDGLHWEKETDEIVKGEEIFGYAAEVFDNKIWLLGCNRNGQFSSQVLVSSDGKSWRGIDAPWSPRGGIAATVYKGKIYMTGGKYGGTPSHPEFRYCNDVWTLEKKVVVR